jgi:hypothetical protein
MMRVLAAWMTGLTLVAAAGGGVLLRILVEGDVVMVSSWVGGALFLPALSILLGELGRSPRGFEAVFLLTWYLGPIRGNRALDFIGSVGPETALHGVAFGVAAAGMAGLVMLRRSIAPRPGPSSLVRR